jgi:uncharacterized protein YbbK (DUF523 family)
VSSASEISALDALRAAPVAVCSACLLGRPCRFDGADKRSALAERALQGKTLVAICPEVEGGLGVPRPPAELCGGDGDSVLDGKARVRSSDGQDVTLPFRRGAELALQAARRYGAQVALLKEGSPSCGVRRVIREGRAVEGRGVTAARLSRSGITVLSDEDLPPVEP